MKVAPKATLLNFEPQFYLVLHFIFYFCLISFCTKLCFQIRSLNFYQAAKLDFLFIFIHCQSIRLKTLIKEFLSSYLRFILQFISSLLRNSERKCSKILLILAVTNNISKLWQSHKTRAYQSGAQGHTSLITKLRPLSFIGLIPCQILNVVDVVVS